LILVFSVALRQITLNTCDFDSMFILTFPKYFDLFWTVYECVFNFQYF